MKEYHKIQSIYKRDMTIKTKNFIIGKYTCPEFELLKDITWEFSEKIDGTNIRVILFLENSINSCNPPFYFKGRTDKAEMPVHLDKALQDIFTSAFNNHTKISQLQNDWGTKLTLYGEGYGEKIQKGIKYRKGNGFVLFDIRIGDWWLKRQDVEVIGALLGLEIAPIIGEGSLDYAIYLVKKGFGSRWGDFTAEGLIARPKVELKDRSGKRIITKIKHVDF